MRTTRIFRTGGSQAVRIPKDFRFDEDEVIIAKVDDMVILYPAAKRWDLMFKAIMGFTEDYMASRDQPTEPDVRAPLD